MLVVLILLPALIDDLYWAESSHIVYPSLIPSTWPGNEAKFIHKADVNCRPMVPALVIAAISVPPPLIHNNIIIGNPVGRSFLNSVCVQT